MDFDSHDYEIRHRKYLSELPENKKTCHTRRMVEHFKLLDDVNATQLQFALQEEVPAERVPLYHANMCKAYFLSQTLMGDMTQILMSTLEPFVGPLEGGTRYRIMPSDFQLSMLDLILGQPETMLKAMVFGIACLGHTQTSTPAMNALSASILALEGNEEARAATDLHLRTVLQLPDFGVQEFMWCLYMLHGEMVRTYRIEVGGEEIKQRRVYERLNRHMDKAIALQPDLPHGYWAAAKHAVASQDIDVAHTRGRQGLQLSQQLGDMFHTCLLANFVGYTIACGCQPLYTLGEIRGLFQQADSAYRDTKRYMHTHDFDSALAFKSLVDQAIQEQDEPIPSSRVLTEPLLLKTGGSKPLTMQHGKFNCDMCNQYAQLKKCSKCKVAAYCSRTCQVAHWKEHKQQCRAAAKSSTAPKPS